MNNINTESKEKNILVGFAVDVSSSMKQSIRNESKKDLNRFESFKDALRKLSRETRKKIENCRENGDNPSVDVFAYVFGLRIFSNCDFLSLIHLRKENVKKSNRKSNRDKNPYRELVKIAQNNGIEDMPGFEKWIQDVLDINEAHRLLSIMNQYTSIASHITKLLPKNIGKAVIAEGRNKTSKLVKIGKWGFLALSFTNPFTAIGGIVAATVAENVIEDKELTKAKKLAKKLANTDSDNDIIEIIIREIGYKRFGQNIKEELKKYGEILMPLEELADLFEEQEEELNKIESYIYGNTPMTETLELIIERFKKELKKMPADTIPVLFLLSDGAPTDGDPLPIAESIKSKNITIVSCFITDQDLCFSRKLFNEIQTSWTKEAKLMYNMASCLEENSVFASSLRELK